MKRQNKKIDEKNTNYKLFTLNKENKLLSESAYVNILEDCFHTIVETKPEKEVNGPEKITVIIPTHNRLEQLTKCIESILNQTYKNVEIIIIDDASSDETKTYFSKINNHKIKYIRNKKNLGVGLSRQKGYNLSSGHYVIFCDDDDYYIDNTYFQDAINIFKDKDINVICSLSYILYEQENIYNLFNLNFNKKIKSLDYLEKFQFQLTKPTSTFPVIFRKSILNKADFEKMRMMNDSSIYLRALMMGGYTYKNSKIIGVYRIHKQNYTLNVKANFTIKNLEEKKKIYKYIQKKNLLKNPTEWFEQEAKITIYYFLNGNEKSRWKRKKVLYWTKKNVSKELFLELKKAEKERVRKNEC